MSILVWLAVGLVGGLLGGWLWGARGRVLGGDAVVGVLGAVLGGFIASVTLGLDIAGFDGTSVLVAAFGTLLLLLVLHALPATDVYD
ncbi:MAG TPA: GlsB/YeaQ/YmgE family stress response membrane protein [Chloroflexota bacterium]|nr:GlsB/YeaQ/YmgE family stress response membrane protein [Chloroflexota bacterium]